jgi:polysaccharide biosynthesis transport protein
MHDGLTESGTERPGEGRAVIAAGQGPIAQAKRDPYVTQAYAAGAQGDGEDFGVILRQFIYMLIKRKWLILSAALVAAALGGVRTMLKTPLYAATVRIQIEREPAKIVEGGSITPSDQGGTDFLRTQFELLKSRALAERVVSSLHIQDDEEFFKARTVSLLSILTGPPKAQLPSPAVRQGWAAGTVLSNMSVLPVAGSRLVDITYVDTNPGRAQQIANGYADAYIAANLDKRLQANFYAKSFLDEQIKQLKIRLEESERALLDFTEQQKMVQETDKTSIAENNLAAANAAVGQLISERIKNEQSWHQVENAKAINLPQLLSNSVIDALRGQRKTLETEYQEKLENFKPSYPAMVAISNKIKEVDRQLAAEVNTIRNSLKGAYESSLSQENVMKARIEALTAEVLDLQKKGIQYNILKREVETNRSLYNSLLQRFKEVDIAGGVGTNNVFIVDKAELPGGPFEPNLPRSLAFSLAIGLGAGIGFAFLLEMIDDRIRAPEEIEQLSGLATLGVIPRVNDDEHLIEIVADPRSTLAEAYRSMASAMQFSTEAGLPKSIAVTSTGAGEGKSVTALAVARYFAQMGLKVLLVDADLRKPSLHTKLNLDNSIGLSNYLTGTSLPPDVLQKTGHANLAFMASGPLPPNAADLLSGTRIFSLISLGSEVFDLIIFDSPPLLGLADAQLLASATAATVFVVGAGDKGKGMIRSALRRLQLARITVIGAVLTKFDPRTVGYAYGYGYGYSYGYGGYHGYGEGYSSGKPLEAAEPNRQLSKLDEQQ